MNKVAKQAVKSSSDQALRKVIRISYIIYTIGLITYLPLLTAGTAFHPSVVTFSQTSSHALLLAAFHVRWIEYACQWYLKSGRELKGLYHAILIMGSAIAPGILFSYVTFRMFKHTGDWGATIALSLDDMETALVMNSVVLSIEIYWIFHLAQKQIDRDGMDK